MGLFFSTDSHSTVCEIYMLQKVKKYALKLVVIIIKTTVKFMYFCKSFEFCKLILIPRFEENKNVIEWEAINCKQITRWQHASRLKASSFGSW